MQNMVGKTQWYILQRVRTVTEEISILATDEDAACMKAHDAEWEELSSDTLDETCNKE